MNSSTTDVIVSNNSNSNSSRSNSNNNNNSSSKLEALDFDIMETRRTGWAGIGGRRTTDSA